MSENNEKKLPSNSFQLMEEEVLKFWEESETFKKSVEKENSSGDYIFYDGPPFITGLPHYGSLLPSIAKDVIPRYQTMTGKRVRRVWGWDCHGLPAENQVEKELKLRNKKDIESLGVDKFVCVCRDYVGDCSSQWKWYINRIGRWVDMDNAYRTMDQGFMESELWAFKKLYEDGFIYEGYRNSLHCTRCATPLSKFEITMDEGSYKDVVENSVVVKFKLKEEDVYVLVWTTTPWTLPGNLALAVGNNIKYLKVNCGGEKYIVAKERAEDIFKGKEFIILEEFDGEELVGSKYENIFNEKDEREFNIYQADFIETESGTGIVHIAPNFGEDDFNLGQKEGIELKDLMDENGTYLKEAGELWEGLYYKKAGEKALELLKDKIFTEIEVTHSYPHCHRCKTPLIYRTQKSWYINIDKVRDRMVELNKEINWIPEFFKEGRFKYNLENAPDWCISRSRYWGTPLPVWKCSKCDEIKVFGSIKEIEQASNQKVVDLHRPDIDEIKFSCDKCSGEMNRIKEVFDSWFDSGAMSFAQFNYPFNEKIGENWRSFLPADFIIEYTGQLRGWFYSLHVLSVALFDSIAYKNVVVSGVLAGTDGRKMSKSLGNYPDPKLTIEKYGSDALRMYFMTNNIMIGEDLNISEKDIQDSMRKNVIVLWNTFEFYRLFAKEGFAQQTEPESSNVLDQWILSKLNSLIENVTEDLNNYNLPAASRPITSFIDDFSVWYVRRSRDRFKGEDESDKKQALETMSFVLICLSRVMAPFAPFISEQIWQRITGKNFNDKNESVHLESWPVAGKIDEDVVKKMDLVREIVGLGLAVRGDKNIKIRQPLNEIIIKGGIIEKEFKQDNRYLELIKDEVNVKDVEFKDGNESFEIELDTEITLELKREGTKRELTRFINSLRKKARLTMDDTADIYFETDNSDIKDLIKEFGGTSLNRNIIEGSGDDVIVSEKVQIEGEEVKLEIKKI